MWTVLTVTPNTAFNMLAAESFVNHPKTLEATLKLISVDEELEE